MKKTFKIVYSALFFLICAAPLALMPFFKTDAKLEKRELTPMPAFMEKGRLNINFSEQFEKWFNDRLPFRANLLTYANVVKGEFFHESASNVIVGKDGWLFFDEESDEYMDTNAFTEDQVKAFAVTLSLLQEDVTSHGGNFVFVCMPNKASVYGEYMPVWYTKAPENNLTRVTSAMEEYGISFVDMKKILTERKDEGLYHRRDSHWNYKGALIGYNAIMDALGRKHDTYSNIEPVYEKTWRGDLDKLLYPAGGVMDYQYTYDISMKPFRFTRPAGIKDTKQGLELMMSDKEQGDDMIITQSMAIRDGSDLYMVRDSFGRAFLPYFINSYRTAQFRRTDRPDVTSVHEGTDYVYEIVERNLGRVIAKAPFMYAPVRDGSLIPSDLKDGGKITPVISVEGYGLKIYGDLPEDTDTGDGRVYIKLSGNGQEMVIEAFPIYEAELLEGEGTKGYSATLSKDLGLKGEYSVNVVTGQTSFDGGSAII